MSLRGSVISTFGMFFFFQAEDGIRDLVRSRGLGDVYKRQVLTTSVGASPTFCHTAEKVIIELNRHHSPSLRGLHDLSLIHI